jgi:glycosyltransferase involved in cell wall biosynthesis
VCSLFRNAPPPLAAYRKLPALVLSDFMAENLRKNGFGQVFKLPAFIQTKETAHTFMPEGVLRILFLGQLIRGKGADLMLQTLSKLEIPFECTIAGEGNDRSLLEKMTAHFRLTDKVRFTGFVSEPEKLWEKCDVFFFPVRWQEPFGLVGLEAMAHGVPAVAFDTGGVREWLSDGETGFVLPEKDIMGAAKVLTRLANSSDLLEKTGRNALALVREKFSEERFIDTFSSLFEVTK